MVEQLTLNQRVAGSSPARFTNCFIHLQALDCDTRQAVVAETVASTRLDRLYERSGLADQGINESQAG